jgi:hypothetical protein
VNSKETSRQNAAIKKRSQLAFHKPGNHTPTIPLPGKKGLDVFGHYMIENALFRPARVIVKSGFRDAATLARK